MDAFASDLSYDVLKRQREESQLAGLETHGAGQRTDRVIVGMKAECLIERLSDEIQPTLYEEPGSAVRHGS